MSYRTTTNYWCDFCQLSLGNESHSNSQPSRARFEVCDLNAKKRGFGVLVIDYDTPDQNHKPDNVCYRCRLAAAKALVECLETLVRLMDKE